MKSFTPEISWHNRLPALSVDISKPIDETGNVYRIATGGNDCRVYIWSIELKPESNNSPNIRVTAGLRRHQKSVGAVRFSTHHMLASGDDDGYIYLWKYKSDNDDKYAPRTSDCGLLNDDGFEDMEVWQQQRVLRGHIEDICDLCWSKDGTFLLSGSVDNSAILWDTSKGTKVWCSDLIRGYVQGVALDPCGQFMAMLSSDRTLRVHNFTERRQLNASKRMNIKNKYQVLFCDDTLQTFCRRLEFTPDGQFLIVPTGRLVDKQSSTPPTNALLVFRVTSFNKPLLYYPTSKEVALCVRVSPVLYKLRDSKTNFWSIPYRIVFAVATARSILIYDSQQPTPIGYASQIHLARLTDIAWSHDGRLLMSSSYDGYSTLITFESGEFGEVYTGPLLDNTPPKVVPPVVVPVISKQPTLHSLWKK